MASVVRSTVSAAQASARRVERAEKFALAQLHQLRGRVGWKGQEGRMLLVAEAAFALGMKERAEEALGGLVGDRAEALRKALE